MKATVVMERVRTLVIRAIVAGEMREDEAAGFLSDVGDVCTVQGLTSEYLLKKVGETGRHRTDMAAASEAMTPESRNASSKPSPYCVCGRVMSPAAVPRERSLP
jgi:hypothetical protein